MASNLRVDSIVPATGSSVSIGTATGGVNIPGVLTYEDVTNVDSVGVITARSGIRLGATGASTLISGTGTGIGIGTITPNSLITIQDTGDTSIRFKNSSSVDKAFVGTSGAFGSAGTDDLRIRSDASNIVFGFSGSERLRIGSSGQLGIGGANYGTSGQVLTSQGASSAIQWATPSSGLAMADMWRLTTTYSIPTNSTSILSTANWERPDQTDGFAQLGTGMSVNSSDHAAGVWTFPSTGFYLVTYNGIVYNGSNDPYEVLIRMEFCENGSTFNIQSRCYGGGEVGNYNPITGQGLVDVTDTSNVKMRLRVYSANADGTLQGNSTENRNYFTVIRLGDT